MFENRKLIIATKHQKEKVIAPLLEKALGVKCFVDEKFDSDIFGTFSGEVERTKDALTTARDKCLLAMQKNNCDLGIASEGSFGAHPYVFFSKSDDEWIVLIDKKNNLEIVARELSLKTNFDGRAINTKEELMNFAEQAEFPSHGLILRKSKASNTDVYKGITDLKILKQTFNILNNKYGAVFVETDMRAMFNPTRMEVIENATKNLIQKVKSKCPNCKMPGFDIKKINKGLPCDLCGMPTKSALSHLYICEHCNFVKEKKYPLDKKTEDPMYCNFCNP